MQNIYETHFTALLSPFYAAFSEINQSITGIKTMLFSKQEEKCVLFVPSE